VTLRANQLLTAARLVLERDDVGAFANRARGSALLARQSIETALAAYWQEVAAGAERASRKAQFVSLRYVLGDPELAASAYQAWAELSTACHHHPYDIGPTAAEVLHWIEVADPVVRALAAATEEAISDRG
jgi:hypothetical protein